MGNQSQKLTNSTFKITFENYKSLDGIHGKVFIWRNGNELHHTLSFACEIHCLRLAKDRSFIVKLGKSNQKIKIENYGGIIARKVDKGNDYGIIYDHDKTYYYNIFDIRYGYQMKYGGYYTEGFYIEGQSIKLFTGDKKLLGLVGMSNGNLLYLEEIKHNILSFVLRYPDGSELQFRETVKHVVGCVVDFKMLRDKVFILYGNEVLVYLHGRLTDKILNVSKMIVDECGGLRLIRLNGNEFHCSYEVKITKVPKCESGTIYIPLPQTTKGEIIRQIKSSPRLIKEMYDIIISYLFELV